MTNELAAVNHFRCKNRDFPKQSYCRRRAECIWVRDVAIR